MKKKPRVTTDCWVEYTEWIHMKYTGIPFFLGPLQITASSGLLSRKPIDMTDKLSSTYCRGHRHQDTWFIQCSEKIKSNRLNRLTTGDQPEPLWWTCKRDKKLNNINVNGSCRFIHKLSLHLLVLPRHPGSLEEMDHKYLCPAERPKNRVKKKRKKRNFKNQIISVRHWFVLFKCWQTIISVFYFLAILLIISI